MSSVHLPARAASVLPDLYALTPIDRFPAHVARIMRRVVAGDKCDVTELDLSTGEFRVLVDPEPPQLAGLADARRAFMGSHPLLSLLRAPPAGAYLVSDMLSRREYHRTPLYAEFFRPLDVEDQLAVGFLDSTDSIAVGITVDRDRRSFDEHERKLFASLQPHLAAARRNAARLSMLTAGTGGFDRRLERLTDRQRQVLAGVATGGTNAQIALALDISEGTVRKHVEHILRLLEVTSRTGAAAIHLTSARAPDSPPWTATLRAADLIVCA